jgi:hypothetical protein
MSSVLVMPWFPDHFSASVLARIRADSTAEQISAVPYFAGLMSEETAELAGSFMAEPEVHHPVRGRVKGAHAFQRFVLEQNAWRFGAQGLRGGGGPHRHRAADGRRGRAATGFADGSRGASGGDRRPIVSPAASSSSCGSISAPGRSRAGTRSGRLCCSRIPRSRRATSWRLPARARRRRRRCHGRGVRTHASVREPAGGAYPRRPDRLGRHADQACISGIQLILKRDRPQAPGLDLW